MRRSASSRPMRMHSSACAMEAGLMWESAGTSVKSAVLMVCCMTCHSMISREWRMTRAMPSHCAGSPR